VAKVKDLEMERLSWIIQRVLIYSHGSLKIENLPRLWSRKM